MFLVFLLYLFIIHIILIEILIPYIIWPLIVYIKNIPFTKNLSFYPLKMQLLLGRQFMTPHWYLFSITIIYRSIFQLLSIFEYI